MYTTIQHAKLQLSSMLTTSSHSDLRNQTISVERRSVGEVVTKDNLDWTDGRREEEIGATHHCLGRKQREKHTHETQRILYPKLTPYNLNP